LENSDNCIPDTSNLPVTFQKLALQAIRPGHHHLNQSTAYNLRLEVALLLR